ncbi:hypothetical protein B0H14DRAFT_3521134 [Mycena olivaceomarginata]|nr:hypothetical protein B0H14DRAFT_3521134 [Mycena olivaceomarginata]
MAAGRWCSVPIYRVPDSPGPIDKYYMEEELEAACDLGDVSDHAEHSQNPASRTPRTPAAGTQATSTQPVASPVLTPSTHSPPIAHGTREPITNLPRYGPLATITIGFNTSDAIRSWQCDNPSPPLFSFIEESGGQRGSDATQREHWIQEALRVRTMVTQSPSGSWANQIDGNRSYAH